tara:strand:- start:48857 stop:49753 length:897 start_codon:yes stop_codon:yes gene_type:complete
MKNRFLSESKTTKLGIIGGSGIYGLEGLSHARWTSIKSPFGNTSDSLLCGKIRDLEIVFLPRHGRGHKIIPSNINYRANIDAFKRLGVTDIISLSAVGSLNEELSPGDFVIVDQFIDRTYKRNKTFFDNGLVAHVSMANPTCQRLGGEIYSAAVAKNLPIKMGGTYVVIEGPQFSTQAESELYREWNCSVIGMTNMPEALLAREAEICYSTVAMVTDYDCWHPEHDNVTVQTVIDWVNKNSHNATLLIDQLTLQIPYNRNLCPHSCDTALDDSLMTEKNSQDLKLVESLDAIIKRVLS